MIKNIDITNLSEYTYCQIDTPDGYQFVGDTISKEREVFRLLFGDGTIIEASNDHKFLTNEGWMKTEDISLEKVLHKDGKYYSIIDRDSLGIKTVYDLEVLHENHRYYSDDFVSHNTGKNYVSLGSITRLMDLNKDKYEKIIYIRKTIISGNKDDELGFLPGDLSEKMNGYIQPMENSIETLIKNKAKKKVEKDDLEELVDDFKKKYDVEYVYGGHLRGQTFPKGSIIILDESQNWDRSTMKTILSRVGENCKVLVMGSNNQIDAAYLGKSNNALTFMMNQCGKENTSNVRIQGINLTNVVRSKVAEWADIAFERD